MHGREAHEGRVVSPLHRRLAYSPVYSSEMNWLGYAG